MKWCHDCVNYTPIWEFQGCSLKHTIRLQCPRYIHDDDWGFYRPKGCKDFMAIPEAPEVKVDKPIVVKVICTSCGHPPAHQFHGDGFGEHRPKIEFVELRP